MRVVCRVNSYSFVNKRFLSNVNQPPQPPQSPQSPQPPLKKTYLDSLSRSEIVGDLQALYKEMERRKYNFRKIWIIGGSVGVVVFYNTFKDWASDQAADVTSKYLENPKFKKDILIFVEATVEELVKSERVQKDVSELLKGCVVQLSESPEIEKKLSELFVRIFKSEMIKTTGAELTDDVVKQILYDEKYAVLRKEATQYIINELIQIINNEELQKNAGVASWNAFKVWFGINPVNNGNTLTPR